MLENLNFETAPAEQSPMLDAALDYAVRGWKVFPCNPDGKEPLGGNGHKDATDDQEQVRRWWTQTPRANIGLALAPSGLVAVDPDTYKPTCGWGEFCAENGIEEIETLTQRSASGGWHYIYAATEGVTYPGALATEVDVKHKGYILLHPSTFAGKPYVWHNDDDPAPAPEWLKPKAAKVVAHRHISGESKPAGASFARTRRALNAVPPETLDYGDWLKVGMVLHHENEGAESALELWDEWSRPDPRYQGIDDLGERWLKFGEYEGDDQVTFGTLAWMAKQKKPDWDLPDWAQGWVYNETLLEFHQIETGHSIKASAFNKKFNRMPDCQLLETPASNVVESKMRTVANTMYWPGMGDYMTHRGLEYVNTYRPHDVTPKAPDTFDAECAVEAVVQHARKLIPNEDEAELFLDFLAWVYQNPGKKVNWAVVLFGIQGNGKTFWLELMKRLMGHNVKEVTGANVAERFTGWAAEAQFIGIEEIKVPSESKYTVLEKLKPLISNSEISIEAKGQDVRTVPNFASYMLLTNHRDALPLDDGDRRYCVIETWPNQKRDVPGDDYFSTLFGALDHIEAIAHYFATRRVSDSFNPTGRAPETAGKAIMMEEAKTGPQLAMEEAIAELNSDVICDAVVYVGGLREQAFSLGDDIQKHLPTPNNMGKVLSEMGYLKYTVGTGVKGPRIGGNMRTIYYNPDLIDGESAKARVTQHITGAPF